MQVETQPSAQSSFQKLNVDNNCQKTRKIRYYIFEVLSSFSVFLQFVPNILARIVVRDRFLFSEKALYQVKANGLNISFNIFQQPSIQTCNENKICKALDFWSRNFSILSFLGKGLGLVFPRNFVYNFSRKMYLMLYSIS